MVSEETSRAFAKEIGAIFGYTSAKKSIGIQELFINLGSKYLDPKFIDNESIIPNVQISGKISSVSQKDNSNNKSKEYNDFRNRRQSVKLNKDNVNEDKKKKCC